MNNENEIEKMELLLVNDILSGHNAEETAAHLHKYGIGDKKQAVKEFAEAEKDCLINTTIGQTQEFNDGYNNALIDVKKIVDNLITELYGADE